MADDPTNNRNNNSPQNSASTNEDQSPQEREESPDPHRQPLPPEMRHFVLCVRQVFREIKDFIVFVRDSGNYNAVLIVLTLALAIAAFTQAVIYGVQLVPLRESAQAAKQASDTAQNSFLMERRRAEDQEEATCRLQTYGTAVSANFDQAAVINDGKVKARNITAHIDAFLNDIVDTDKKIRDIGSVDLSAGELAGNSQSLTQQFNLALSARDWQNLTDTNQMIVYKGHVGYENGFGRLVDQPYCMAWYFFRSATDQNNPVQGRGTPCSNLPAQMNEVRREKANLKH